jgi:hypothetical protein
MEPNTKKNLKLFLAALALCAVNAAVVLAQPVEINVTGGGFIIRGPSSLSFMPQPFSYEETSSAASFKDAHGTSPQYLEISDQTGGNAFSVALAADDLTPNNSGVCDTVDYSCIPKSFLAVRNNDGSSAGDPGTPGITVMDNGGMTNTGSNACTGANTGSGPDVCLDSSTAYQPSQPLDNNNPAAPATDPASLSEQRIVFRGTGAAPGTWRIYPQLQETTPSGTVSGNYSGIVTITVMTNP